ncbi:hypothetical protein JKY79_02600 [Candidatus Babeliales bacterium]|nr:hypothetical protein [Candidatus Babeliales bacterium]
MVRLLDYPDKCRKFLAKAEELGLKNIKQLDDYEYVYKSNYHDLDDALCVTMDVLCRRISTTSLTKLLYKLFGGRIKKFWIVYSIVYLILKDTALAGFNDYISPPDVCINSLHEWERYDSTYLLEIQFEKLGELTPKWHLRNKIYKPITEIIYKFVNVDVGNIVFDYMGFTSLFEFVDHLSTVKIQRHFYDTVYQIVKCEYYKQINKEVKYSLIESDNVSWIFTLGDSLEDLNKKTTIIGGYYLTHHHHCIITGNTYKCFSYLY